MSFRKTLAFTLFVVCGSICSSLPLQAENLSATPNVILMMADDMGWGDVSFAVRLGKDSSGDEVLYEGTTRWETSNLDAMASSGLTFSRMYSQSPVCSPTRASVLTGRNPERVGIPFANRGNMENREVTIAEYAKTQGYATGLFGKWHLGSMTRDFADSNRGGPRSHDIYSTPLNNGFDVMYATESKTSTHDPATSRLTPTTRYWTGPGEFIPLSSSELQGDDSAIIARETIEFIEQATQADQPFLAVSWFHTPHKPVNTPGNEDVDNLAAYRFAMEGLDAAIGQIRSKVQSLGIAEDTLIMFTSDNGPEDGQDYNRDGLRANKRELYEGGIRVPGIIEWPGHVSPGVTHTPMVTTDYLPTLLDIWGIDAVDDRPIDGTSMVETVFTDRDAVRDRTIIFKSTNGHQAAMGVGGQYKLISTNNGSSWTLYDLVNGHRENNALATSANIEGKEPKTQAIYNQLKSDYDAWVVSVADSTSESLTGDYETRIAQSDGITVKREPPQSLENDLQGGGTTNLADIFLERQYATLQRDLTLDSGGTNGTHGTGDRAILAKGTVVHSFLIDFDSTTDDASGNMEVTFDDKILGVIGESALLGASDSLSFADPEFEPDPIRGLEADDSWTISNNGYTISMDWRTSVSDLDQVRILTESSLQIRTVPEPDASMLFGISCLFTIGLIRRLGCNSASAVR